MGKVLHGRLARASWTHLGHWISTQAKDGLNAAGIGAYFNVLNASQMLLWHVTLLPLVVGVLVVLHVVLVRRHGVVPPIDAQQPRVAAEPEGSVDTAGQSGLK
jgi:quinol-cytochrome oxidoreductase complex cytochrome b subunit